MVALFPDETHAPVKRNNEWFTPSRYIEAAREVMGEIDLDPASCEQANRTVKATRYYTEQENGLIQPWYGRVWLNAPFGRIRPELKGSTRGFQKLFSQKLLDEYRQGNIEQAITLTNGNPNCTWFHPFFDYPLCFLYGHINFDRPDGTVEHYGYPLTIAYLGTDEQKFIEVFSGIGRVVKAVSIPMSSFTSRSLWEEST